MDSWGLEGQHAVRATPAGGCKSPCERGCSKRAVYLARRLSRLRRVKLLHVSDRYTLSHELGRGGMAVVYLARQTDLDRWVALKELRPEGRDESVVRRFLREARLAGSLSHPNIVTVLDFFEADGAGYIAMEYVPRGSLRPLRGRADVRPGRRRARGRPGRADLRRAGRASSTATSSPRT